MDAEEISCINYGCDSSALGLFHRNLCNKEFIGNHDQAIAFGCSATTTDFEDETTILDDINNNRAWRILDARFTINKPTANKTESIVPCRPSTVDSYSYTGDYQNPNVNSDNDDVHQLLFSGMSIGALLIRECQSRKDGYMQAKLIVSEIKFEGGLVSVTGEKQRYEGTFSWEGYHPKTIEEAAGIWL